MNQMILLFAAQIPLASDTLLCELYDKANISPLASTQAALKTDAGIVFNMLYLKEYNIGASSRYVYHAQRMHSCFQLSFCMHLHYIIAWLVALQEKSVLHICQSRLHVACVQRAKRMGLENCMQQDIRLYVTMTAGPCCLAVFLEGACQSCASSRKTVRTWCVSTK